MFFYFECYGYHRYLHSVPTRRSSDLDDEYAILAPEAYKYLNGRAEFVVAGNPACTDELKAAGINDFVHVRCNVLDTLRDFNNRLLNK